MTRRGRATSAAEATVQDVNRQAWTASVDLLVHPADRYVGLRTARAFVEKGEPIPVDVVVTDLDGQATPGRTVQVRAERLEWEQVAGEWSLVPEGLQEREVVPGPSRCTSLSRATRAGRGGWSPG